MNYNIVSYLIGEGFKNVLKNKKSTFAAFIIMFVTMITVGLGIAGGSNITSIINQLENDFPINVYIEDTASQDDIKDMEEQIKSIEYVNNVTYTSKEKALEKERKCCIKFLYRIKSSIPSIIYRNINRFRKVIRSNFNITAIR